VNFDIRPGATLEKLREKLTVQQTRDNPNLVIVIAGICNLTDLTRVHNKKTVTYNLDGEIRSTKKALIKGIVEDLLEKKCIISTIAPAKLTAQAAASKPLTNPEQEALLADLDDINCFIKSECERRNTQILNLAKTCYQSSRKRRGNTRKTVWQFNDTELPDGVHLSDNLKTRWAKILANCIRNHYESEYPQESEDL
jgi:lysophospholipase L1-like esterase